jgi:hypothetical protein
MPQRDSPSLLAYFCIESEPKDCVAFIVPELGLDSEPEMEPGPCKCRCSSCTASPAVIWIRFASIADELALFIWSSLTEADSGGRKPDVLGTWIYEMGGVSLSSIVRVGSGEDKEDVSPVSVSWTKGSVILRS